VSTDVFLSVGRTSTPEQESFVTALEDALRSEGLAPRTVGRTDRSSIAPLKRIAEVMDECHGTVVLAYERTHSPLTIDRPSSPSEQRLADVRLPSVWNQIEAAMSYSRGLPLLVVVEHGLRDEGLLEARYDWFVQWLDLTEQALGSNEFRAVLADWAKRVKEHQNAPPASAPVTPTNPAERSLKELVGALTLPQLWAGLGSCAAVLIAVATIAYKLGSAS
jgi:hypothetical protein